MPGTSSRAFRFQAGPTAGRTKGRSTTRASRPAARTIAPGVTSPRITARPTQRPPPLTAAPGSGTHATLVTRPTSRSRCVTALQPSAGAAGGSTSNRDRKSTRLNSSHRYISYAVFSFKKNNITTEYTDKHTTYRASLRRTSTSKNQNCHHARTLTSPSIIYHRDLLQLRAVGTVPETRH